MTLKLNPKLQHRLEQIRAKSAPPRPVAPTGSTPASHSEAVAASTALAAPGFCDEVRRCMDRVAVDRGVIPTLNYTDEEIVEVAGSMKWAASIKSVSTLALFAAISLLAREHPITDESPPRPNCHSPEDLRPIIEVMLTSRYNSKAGWHGIDVERMVRMAAQAITTVRLERALKCAIYAETPECDQAVFAARVVLNEWLHECGLPIGGWSTPTVEVGSKQTGGNATGEQDSPVDEPSPVSPSEVRAQFGKAKYGIDQVRVNEEVLTR